MRRVLPEFEVQEKQARSFAGLDTCQAPAIAEYDLRVASECSRGLLPTPEIFISYARGDAPIARQFADALVAEGLDVWWDDALQAGEVFDERIEAALRAAKAVVVLWSPLSVSSRWVRAEATLADRKSTLVPVLIEACERPIIFELVQTADLIGWRGTRHDARWQGLVRQVRDFIGTDRHAPSSSPKLADPQLDRQSIVVLPFNNVSRDEEQEYFADGIAEDIINDLGKVSALSVIARSTAFTFKGQTVDVAQVARQLNVTHVLEGSVRKAGNRVRVNVQLIDGASGAQVWSERYDRDLDDIFELQDELSQAIVSALKVQFQPGERDAISERATQNVELYDLYMRARAAANAAISGAQYVAALELYREVLAKDPAFYPALGGLTLMLQQQSVFAFTPEVRSDFQIEQLVAMAEHLPQDSSEAHLIRAVHYRWERKWDLALLSFDKALETAPVYASEIASLKGTCLFCVGRVSEAIEVAESARRADPMAGYNSLLLQMLYLASGRRNEGDAEYERSKTFPVNRAVCEHARLFRIWNDGDMREIKEQAQRHLRYAMVEVPYRAELYQVIDDREKTIALLLKALADPASRSSTISFILSYHCGDFDAQDLALDALERGLSTDAAMDYAVWWPSHREVRKTTRFKELVRKFGYYDYWRRTGEWGDFARPVGDDDFEIIA
ncbi:TIR domain-containing protein [Qipengyuania soli]|uniref:TIR domain-containing protein n=1 Tax=Qipengyuania soli TaxID=2782568 RepID=A0A7S8F2Z2_9SPHN|nr:TIR domain-containing protein [Qipengyuania soli]QPC98196.1 TIR domain-containing protein [Qipengyuania soli]